MLDLLTILPFAGVGIVIVLVALAFGRQTTLSARRIDDKTRRYAPRIYTVLNSQDTKVESPPREVNVH